MKQALKARHINMEKLYELLSRLFAEEGWKVKLKNRREEYVLDVPRCLTDEEIDSVTMRTTELW
ncbi:hypothetical protein K469DRAFT_706012 [Zopfia rhizophila CBS 207.26]|uniref:Uncharacterized protein n=1 Tax=Zopfia rhizophila CBS 207.26 TaxID=1314779 RepID=A0A6A6EU66_9PEZI|nr:hypothetical protein K469DRAFT_706012 [Zopfia rhizophila CBS 207.26]